MIISRAARVCAAASVSMLLTQAISADEAPSRRCEMCREVAQLVTAPPVDVARVTWREDPSLMDTSWRRWPSLTDF